MIQRIQTVYLLLAIAACAALLCFPLVSICDGAGVTVGSLTAFSASFTGGTLPTVMPVWVLAAFVILGILLRVIAIFSFKNRRNQLRTCRSLLLADGCFVALAAVLVWQLSNQLPESHEISFAPYFVCAFPLLAIVFTLLAMRGIRHDERLVRAADRLR